MYEPYWKMLAELGGHWILKSSPSEMLDSSSDFMALFLHVIAILTLCSLFILDILYTLYLQMYLKVIDKVNQQYVSVFMTAGSIKFLLLHSGKGEVEIKNFFHEVYDFYVKHAMNPFYKYDTPITSTEFDKRVRAVARRNLL